MRNRTQRLAFAGALLLLAVLVAGVVSGLPGAVMALTFLGPVFGAVTVTYEHPVTGVVAPTAVQAKQTVVANVIATADADTTAVIVHNMGVSAADLLAGFPHVILQPLLQVVAGLSLWAITGRTADNITLTKSTAVGSGNAGAQLRVAVLEPHTIGR